MNYHVMSKPRVAIQRINRRGINPVYRFPSVSIFLPFNPKMEMKSKLTFLLSKATYKATSELRDKYPGEMAMLVIQKLKIIIRNLNFSTHKKSLAIFVSPVFEKVYYLNIDVEEKVIVNESLQIQDLVHSKKQSQQFHILLLSENEGRIYLGDTRSSVRIARNNLKSERACQNDLSGRISNFPDAVTKQEIGIEKFLYQVDQSMGKILKTDGLPIFVMGTEKIVKRFKGLTLHNEAFAECVYGDFEGRSLDDLKSFLKSYTTDWQKIKQKNLIHQLSNAAGKNRLSTGMEDVKREVGNRRAQLLLLENEYLFDDDTASWRDNTPNYKTTDSYNIFSNIKKPVDEIIEMVLENGGDVELVSNGLLKDHGQIVLLNY